MNYREKSRYIKTHILNDYYLLHVLTRPELQSCNDFSDAYNFAKIVSKDCINEMEFNKIFSPNQLSTFNCELHKYFFTRLKDYIIKRLSY